MNSKTEGFLPPKDADNPEYTLILDLDETLIHFAEDEEKEELLKHAPTLKYKLFRRQIYEITEDDEIEYFHVRPYATKLLRDLSRYFEIVIFTAGTKDYADAILNKLHSSKYISYRLYRHHTLQEDDVFVKDLELIGRPLDKTIIVDNTKENFMYHNENGIPIHSWFDDENDKVLFDLTRILRNIAESKPNDIRDGVKKWREVIDKYIQYGERLPERVEDQFL